MNTNEIKKVLYKEKPVAILCKPFLGSNNQVKNYRASTSLGIIYFTVPFSEMGEKIFEDELPSQLLIRWMVTN